MFSAFPMYQHWLLHLISSCTDFFLSRTPELMVRTCQPQPWYSSASLLSFLPKPPCLPSSLHFDVCLPHISPLETNPQESPYSPCGTEMCVPPTNPALSPYSVLLLSRPQSTHSGHALFCLLGRIQGISGTCWLWQRIPFLPEFSRNLCWPAMGGLGRTECRSRMRGETSVTSASIPLDFGASLKSHLTFPVPHGCHTSQQPKFGSGGFTDASTVYGFPAKFSSPVNWTWFPSSPIDSFLAGNISWQGGDLRVCVALCQDWTTSL